MTTTHCGGTLIAMALLVAGCASAPSVQTTVDPQGDLAGHRTFVFLDSGPKAEGAITDKLANDRLRHMIALKLAAKGYAPAISGAKPDLGVHYAGRVTPRQSVLMVGQPGPYDYGWGRTDIGGYDTQNYRQGTLFIDLVDLGKKQLLWRSSISEAFSEGYSEDNWKKVDRALDEAFKSVPQRR